MATEPATEPVQNGAPVRGKRRTGDWQEYLVLVLLTAAYSIGGGFMFTMGLLQAAWISESSDKLKISTDQASIINSVTLAAILVPAPAVQILVQKLELRPWALFAIISVPLTAALNISSASDSFADLLISNGLLLGPCVTCVLIGGYMTLFYYFTDDQIPLYYGVSSSGFGIGILTISVLFTFLQPSLGWRGIQRCELALPALLLVIGIVLHPTVSRWLGIQTRKDKLRQLLSSGEHHPLLPSIEESARSELDDPRVYSITIELSNKVSSVAYIFTSKPFIMVLLSWALSAPVANSILVYQPTRMMKLGFSLKQGAQSFIGTGVLQILSRASSGLVVHKNWMSAPRLSQLVKLGMVLFTALSNVSHNITYQTFYSYYLAILLGTASTTDYIMIKDSLKYERETGMALFSCVNGIGSFVGVQLIGYFLRQCHSFVIQFYAASAITLVSVLFALLHERAVKVANSALLASPFVHI